MSSNFSAYAAFYDGNRRNSAVDRSSNGDDNRNSPPRGRFYSDACAEAYKNTMSNTGSGSMRFETGWSANGSFHGESRRDGNSSQSDSSFSYKQSGVSYNNRHGGPSDQRNVQYDSANKFFHQMDFRGGIQSDPRHQPHQVSSQDRGVYSQRASNHSIAAHTYNQERSNNREHNNGRRSASQKMFENRRPFANDGHNSGPKQSSFDWKMPLQQDNYGQVQESRMQNYYQSAGNDSNGRSASQKTFDDRRPFANDGHNSGPKESSSDWKMPREQDNHGRVQESQMKNYYPSAGSSSYGRSSNITNIKQYTRDKNNGIKFSGAQNFAPTGQNQSFRGNASNGFFSQFKNSQNRKSSSSSGRDANTAFHQDDFCDSDWANKAILPEPSDRQQRMNYETRGKHLGQNGSTAMHARHGIINADPASPPGLHQSNTQRKESSSDWKMPREQDNHGRVQESQMKNYYPSAGSSSYGRSSNITNIKQYTRDKNNGIKFSGAQNFAPTGQNQSFRGNASNGFFSQFKNSQNRKSSSSSGRDANTAFHQDDFCDSDWANKAILPEPSDRQQRMNYETRGKHLGQNGSTAMHARHGIINADPASPPGLHQSNTQRALIDNHVQSMPAIGGTPTGASEVEVRQQLLHYQKLFNQPGCPLINDESAHENLSQVGQETSGTHPSENVHNMPACGVMSTGATECDVKQQLMNYQRQFDQAVYPFINDVSAYEKLSKIGEGSFGEVFKARCRQSGRMVALKKILTENEKEGFPITALREVKILAQLKHQNIIELIEVCSAKGNTATTKDRTTFYIVMPFCEHDLAGLLSNPKVRMSLVHIKTMMKHLITGLNKLHRNKILHRDIKSANVLISREGVLKLADFGLARSFMTPKEGSKVPHPLYTNHVVTLWYRPPELLLGDRTYRTKVDVWGVGCIMAEMWTRQPIMRGDTEQRQLQLISALCGSINPEVWPGCTNMPLWANMTAGPNSALPQDKPRLLRNRLHGLMKIDCPGGKPPAARYNPYNKHRNTNFPTDVDAMNLLELLLAIDPEKRPTAEEAEDNIWFYKDPMPRENIGDLMDTISTSQFQYTVGKGAHAGRDRNHNNNQQPAQVPRLSSTAIPDGHYRDVIY